MDRREFLSSSAMLAAASAVAGSARAAPAASGGVQSSLKGPHLDLATPRGARDAWARLQGNIDMKSTKYGWYRGVIQGVRPGESVRDLIGFTGFSCAKLIRVDFSAAGTLLNWVSAREAENRSVQFSEVNRLVASFFNVIGISEHARVIVRSD